MLIQTRFIEGVFNRTEYYFYSENSPAYESRWFTKAELDLAINQLETENDIWHEHLLTSAEAEQGADFCGCGVCEYFDYDFYESLLNEYLVFKKQIENTKGETEFTHRKVMHEEIETGTAYLNKTGNEELLKFKKRILAQNKIRARKEAEFEAISTGFYQEQVQKLEQEIKELERGRV